jgi:hypothetical protein
VLAYASLWLFSPFATGAVLGSWSRAREFATRHQPLFVCVGVGGIALVVLGTFVLARPLSLAALGLGGPLSGLSFWVPRRHGGDDWPGGGDDDPGDPPPGGDWDRIVREFERFVDRWPEPAPSSPAPVAPRREPVYAPSARAITICCTSSVPSPMVRILASR